MVLCCERHYRVAMCAASPNRFEVLSLPEGGFRVLVNGQAIADHACAEKAAEHCARLQQRDAEQDGSEQRLGTST